MAVDLDDSSQALWLATCSLEDAIIGRDTCVDFVFRISSDIHTTCMLLTSCCTAIYYDGCLHGHQYSWQPARQVGKQLCFLCFACKACIFCTAFVFMQHSAQKQASQSVENMHSVNEVLARLHANALAGVATSHTKFICTTHLTCVTF